jgi:hypothetical protein
MYSPPKSMCRTMDSGGRNIIALLVIVAAVPGASPAGASPRPAAAAPAGCACTRAAGCESPCTGTCAEANHAFYSKHQEVQLPRNQGYGKDVLSSVFPSAFIHRNVHALVPVPLIRQRHHVLAAGGTQHRKPETESQQRALRPVIDSRTGQRLRHVKLGCDFGSTHSALSGLKSTRPDISSSLSLPASFLWSTAGCKQESTG